MAEGINVATLVAQLKLDLGNFQQAVQGLDANLAKARKGLEGTGKQADAFGAAVTKAEARLGALGIQSVGLSRALALLANPLTIVGVSLGAMAFGAHQATEALIENAREVRGLMAVSGLSAEAADNLGDTFTVLGFNAGTVANAMFRMSNEIESGAAGLGRLGISTRDATGSLKAEGDLFLEVRDRISQLGSAGERSAALIDIFGRAGRELAPVFALNREEFQRWMQTASALSPWSQQTQADTEALIRSQNALSIAWKGMWEELGQGLAGPGTRFNTWLTDVVTRVGDALRITRQFFEAGGGLGGLTPPPPEPGGGVSGPAAGTGTGITRRTQAEFGQEAALLRLSLQQRMAHVDQVAALRGEALAAEQIDQKTLLQGALADFAAREQATREYFTRQRAIIVEQMGSTEAAAKTKLAELDAQQVSAISQIGTARINARAQLAAVELAQTKQLQAQEIAGWVAVAEEEFTLTEQRLQDEVKVRDALTPLWEQMKADGIGVWTAIADAQMEATEASLAAVAQQNAAMTEALRAARELRETGLGGIAAQGAAIRGGGGQSDVTGTQLRAVEAALGNLAVQRAELQAVIGNVEEGTDRFYELQGAIAASTAEMERLTVAAQGLQQITALKGVVADVFGALNRAISTSITGVIQGTLTTKQAFENMGQSILLSIQEVIIKRAFKALEQAFDQMLDTMDQRAVISGALKVLGSLLGGGGAGGGGDLGAAGGGGTGGLQAAASGGIVEKPTVLLAGEKGSEAIIPLSELGRYVAPAGGGDEGGGGLTVVINNYSNSEVETSQSMSADGKRQLEIMVHEAVRRGIGGGGFDHILQSTYGLSRQGTRR